MFLRFLRILFIFFIVLVFTGCAEAYESVRPVSSVSYYNFFLKSKEFLALCSYLISQENPQLKQILSRIYYSYFMVARAYHIGRTNKYEKVKHDIIWNINKKNVRKKYGEDLKKMRTYYDYDPASVDDKMIDTKNNLRFIADNEDTYKTLINDAKSQIPKFYKYDENAQEWVDKTNKIIDSLEKEHNEFVSKIREITS